MIDRDQIARQVFCGLYPAEEEWFQAIWPAISSGVIGERAVPDNIGHLTLPIGGTLNAKVELMIDLATILADAVFELDPDSGEMFFDRLDTLARRKGKTDEFRKRLKQAFAKQLSYPLREFVVWTSDDSILEGRGSYFNRDDIELLVVPRKLQFDIFIDGNLVSVRTILKDKADHVVISLQPRLPKQLAVLLKYRGTALHPVFLYKASRNTLKLPSSTLDNEAMCNDKELNDRYIKGEIKMIKDALTSKLGCFSLPRKIADNGYMYDGTCSYCVIQPKELEEWFTVSTI